jgi:uncharacterized membrane protein
MIGNTAHCLIIWTFSDTFSNNMDTNIRPSTYRFAFFSTLLWCVSIVTPPIAQHLGLTTAAEMILGFFSRICHQIDSHSLHIFDTKFAVCARCTAIYTGFFLGVLFYPLIFRRIGFLPISRIPVLTILPLLLDVFLSATGVHESTGLSRILTGLVFGISLPFVLLKPAEEALKELRLKFSTALRRSIPHAS